MICLSFFAKISVIFMKPSRNLGNEIVHSSKKFKNVWYLIIPISEILLLVLHVYWDLLMLYYFKPVNTGEQFKILTNWNVNIIWKSKLKK